MSHAPKLLVVIGLWSAVLGPMGRLQAHPSGHEHAGSSAAGRRTWSVVGRTTPVKATFESSRDGQVRLRRDDGSLVTLRWNELAGDDQHWISHRQIAIRALNRTPAAALVSTKPATRAVTTPVANAAASPALASAFQPFEKSLKVRWDERFLYVESNGIPDHALMVGIRAWQQQVPIPQKYVGQNAWRIPLEPKPAKEPISARNHFLRGAIALAVNGVPIFNPLNNRGDDAYLVGELDEYGGHCGRADDYHYHLAPVHLEKMVGKGHPIAVALDGYPILGYQHEQDSDYAPLDRWNGHTDKAGRYHYHATKTYPYLNGGFYGEVVEREGQVDPQPRAEPLRPALPPLRDARITEFKQLNERSYRLVYDVRGKQGSVSYTLHENGSARFTFVTPDGRTTTETYEPRGGGRGSGRGDRPPDDRPAREPKPDGKPAGPREKPKPARESPKPERKPSESMGKADERPSSFRVSSSSVDERGFLSSDCTCDGAGATPAVAWSGAPAGTRCFALSLWHVAPDQEKSYWVVYNIPANVTELPRSVRGVGVVGQNDKRRAAYDPLCSKGPGVKKYHLTLFALSEEPKLTASEATRAQLLAAIKQTTLASSTLDVYYERKK